jgi:hypothetical protein
MLSRDTDRRAVLTQPGSGSRRDLLGHGDGEFVTGDGADDRGFRPSARSRRAPRSAGTKKMPSNRVHIEPFLRLCSSSRSLAAVRGARTNQSRRARVSGTGLFAGLWLFGGLSCIFCPRGPHKELVMRRAFVLGAAALVASWLFAQDAFAQRSGSRGFGEGGNRAAVPGYVGHPRLRVVVRPGLRWAGQPRLIYYPYSDLPYVPVGTPPFYLAGHAGKIDSCWGWDGYQWLNFCAGSYPGF